MHSIPLDVHTLVVPDASVLIHDVAVKEDR